MDIFNKVLDIVWIEYHGLYRYIGSFEGIFRNKP